MILSLFLTLCCVTATFGIYNTEYISAHPQYVSDDLKEGRHYGQNGAHVYDHGGLRHLQQNHAAHGARDYGAGDAQGLRDIAKQVHHKEGAHAAAHSSGGQQGHVREAHDRGSYEKEKKYGYEKAYGYERETKHHDKADNAKGYGSAYNHNENRGHYNQGGQALRDLASHGNKYHHGSDSHGNRGALLDFSKDYNRQSDVASNYGHEDKIRDLHLAKPAPVLRYYPLVPHRNFAPDVDHSLQRFRYLSGIHGLGGLRGNGLGLGYNPLRYGYDNNGYLGGDLPLRYPLPAGADARSTVYFIKPPVQVS